MSKTKNASAATLVSAVAVVCNAAQAAPAFRILYHEAIKTETTRTSGDTQHLTFDAYGRQFNIKLRPNPGIRRAVPAGRSDIEPMAGEVEGETGSWVRLTHSRSGWRGLISQGGELYAIEPASEVASAVVQPLDVTSGTAPVIYRLKDALLPLSPAYCAVEQADNPAASPTDDSSTEGRVTAKMMYDAVAKDVSSGSLIPNLKLTVG